MKIEAYKDSNGRLHETRESYILAEADIKKEQILETWDIMSEAINFNL
jgi:hypothetical protein